MTFTARTSAYIIVAAALAAAFGAGGTGASATDLVPAPSTATVHQLGRSLSGTWRAPFSVPDTRTLHVDLPPELAGYDIDGLNWSLSGYSEDVTGSIPATVTSFDIAVPQEFPRSSLVEVTITSAAGSSSDHVRLEAMLDNSVGPIGVPPRTVADVDFSLTKALQSQVDYSYSAFPSPAFISPGGTLTLAGTYDLWGKGPNGDWSDPDSLFVEADLIDAASESSIQLDYDIADDGDSLQLTVPATLPAGFEESNDLRVSVTIIPDASGSALTTRLSFSVRVLFDQDPVIDRITGADRTAVAVAVSEQAYPDGAPVVYVVTGSNFPDALSAGPAAAKEGGPLLLTTGASLAPAVADELHRLHPSKIVVVGGPASVPQSVFAQLNQIAATDRVSGADRYEVSRNLLAYAFPNGSSFAYVATGATFPDALSAGAPAGKAGAPVVLVNGASDAVDAPTAEALRSLHPESLTVAGGPASVSPGMEKSLASIVITNRIGGADRYAVSTAIIDSAYAFVNRAFLVTGSNFPDALSGAAWAGVLGAPLYVVHTDCVPPADLAAMRLRGVQEVTLIGGPVSLTEDVFELTPCAS
ncbi:cell wall-binding repeat-containing protein [Herbiconiux sp. CPCC 205763]|uniref:Cell wall-binding repeat-containing protein n=1 Tax=Herbiconiux aconitum TaxID=2970913 RepID=A0ABT2GU40_9MICO|nr:cell wall-binding repeat-containing protein [Herbiconiux aconitum]MCS5719726.1 cell wall-binding repeat-containing protein [Herbiconiux aconitum]